MSTLKVSNINNESATSGGIQIDSSGAISGALPYPNRNLLYNGAMQVAQRGTSTASITSGGYYTADRWYESVNSMGTWTQSVENDAPTGSGFRKSLKVLCTTADAAPADGDSHSVYQALEGQDLQRIAKGTASAQEVTISFWVKANVTGTYIVELYDNDNNRQVSGSYSVSASATWEKKKVTFPVDSTGAFDNDNARSLDVAFWLGAGSTFTSGTLNTSWASNTNANRAVGQTNLAAATNNYWQITGVQLEVGDTATEFEHLPFGVELARCQRYYEKSYDYSVVPGTVTDVGSFRKQGPQNSFGITGEYTVEFAVEKRTNPTVTYYSTNNGAAGYIFNRYDASGNTANRNSGLYANPGTRNCNFGVGSGVGIGYYLPNDSTFIKFQWTASAEL